MRSRKRSVLDRLSEKGLPRNLSQRLPAPVSKKFRAKIAVPGPVSVAKCTRGSSMNASFGYLARLSAVLVLLASIAAIPTVAGPVTIDYPNFGYVANCAGVSTLHTLAQGALSFISTIGLGSGCVNLDPFAGTWSVTNDVGVWNPGASIYYPSGTPGGNNIAFANNGSIYQVLSSAVALGTYTLTVEIGGRCYDAPINNYTVELLAGGSTVIASDSSNSSILSGTSGLNCGNFVLDTISGTTNNSLVGEPLEIVLSAIGTGPLDIYGNYDASQVTFTDVTLDGPSAIPEPSTLTLFGSGLLAMAYLFRRKRFGQS